jgi:hypothetical protein
MITAEGLFNEATEAGIDVAVLFGDATNCRRLVYWARLTGISVGDEDTHYTVFPVYKLPAVRSTQDLSRYAEVFTR